jgi:hypothetical protein
MGAGAAFQVADAAAAQTRPLGQRFLAQPCREAMLPQQIAEGREVGEVVGVHGRSLGQTRRMVARWVSGLAGF